MVRRLLAVLCVVVFVFGIATTGHAQTVLMPDLLLAGYVDSGKTETGVCPNGVSLIRHDYTSPTGDSKLYYDASAWYIEGHEKPFAVILYFGNDFEPQWVSQYVDLKETGEAQVSWMTVEQLSQTGDICSLFN